MVSGLRAGSILAAAAALAVQPLAAPASAADADAGIVAYLAWTDGYWQVWTVSPNGADARQVTRSEGEKTALSWFPDGRRILVNTLEGRPLIVDVATGGEQPLALDRETLDAAIAPDGRRIAYSALNEGGVDDNDIWLAEIGGGAPRKLVAMAWLQHAPRWSRDGSAIYFLSGPGEKDHDIWRASVENGSRRQITVDSRYHFETDVAASGALAYSSNATGSYEIYTLRPGGKPVQWTEDSALDAHPTWSPDESALIFHSTRSGRLDLWRLDAPGGTPRRLTDHAGGARGPVWWAPGDGAS